VKFASVLILPTFMFGASTSGETVKYANVWKAYSDGNSAIRFEMKERDIVPIGRIIPKYPIHIDSDVFDNKGKVLELSQFEFFLISKNPLVACGVLTDDCLIDTNKNGKFDSRQNTPQLLQYPVLSPISINKSKPLSKEVGYVVDERSEKSSKTRLLDVDFFYSLNFRRYGELTKDFGVELCVQKKQTTQRWGVEYFTVGCSDYFGFKASAVPFEIPSFPGKAVVTRAVADKISVEITPVPKDFEFEFSYCVPFNCPTADVRM
jgi:hypothetical protein